MQEIDVPFRLKSGSAVGGVMSPGVVLLQQLTGLSTEKTEPQNQSSLGSSSYGMEESCLRMLPELCRADFA